MLLLGNRARITLGLGYAVESTSLVDSTVGARHQLDKRIIPIIESLQSCTHSEDELLEKFHNQGISLHEAMNCILTLNSIGALNIKQSYRDAPARLLSYLRAFLLGIKVAPITHRSSIKIRSLIMELWKISLLLTAMWLVSLVAVQAMGTISMPYYISRSTMTFMVLFMSLLAHEYSHILALKENLSRSVIIRKGWRIGILHPPLTRRAEVTSAIAGPIMGILTSAFISVVFYVITPDTIWLGIGTLFAICHSASLIPSFGDGWTILRKITGKRYA